MDFELDLLKKMQGFKQERKSVQEYIEEFYQVLIRVKHAKDNKEKVTYYLNGLRPRIWDELGLV